MRFMLAVTLLLTMAGSLSASELYIEFAYTAPADKTVDHFAVYRDNQLFCQTSSGEVRTVSCPVTAPTVDTSYTFTLRAVFADNTESPQSPAVQTDYKYIATNIRYFVFRPGTGHQSGRQFVKITDGVISPFSPTAGMGGVFGFISR